MKVKSLSCAPQFGTPWTVAYQVPLSMGFFRQEYWSGLPFPSPGDLPDPGMEPCRHCRQTLYRLSHQGSLGATQVVKPVLYPYPGIRLRRSPTQSMQTERGARGGSSRKTEEPLTKDREAWTVCDPKVTTAISGSFQLEILATLSLQGPSFQVEGATFLSPGQSGGWLLRPR